MLPHQCGKKRPIILTIGNVTYEAGVHETKGGIVWISSVLYKKDDRRGKVYLVDALQEVGLKKGDKIAIKKKLVAVPFYFNPTEWSRRRRKRGKGAQQTIH